MASSLTKRCYTRIRGGGFGLFLFSLFGQRLHCVMLTGQGLIGNKPFERRSRLTMDELEGA